MFEFTVPAGAKMPLPHKHERDDETIYGVEGLVTFTVEGKKWTLPRGNPANAPGWQETRTGRLVLGSAR
jgi:quercetin dioxygenase-like cupin family protein